MSTVPTGASFSRVRMGGTTRMPICSRMPTAVMILRALLFQDSFVAKARLPLVLQTYAISISLMARVLKQYVRHSFNSSSFPSKFARIFPVPYCMITGSRNASNVTPPLIRPWITIFR